MIDLRLGDCAAILKQIPSKSIDCIITDPPYEVAINGGGTINTKCKLNESLKVLTDSKIDKGYDFKINYELVRIMKSINIYIWCNKKQIMQYLNYYVNQLGCLFEIICWHKSNALPTYSNKYVSDTEYCLYFHESGHVNPECYEDAKTWWISPLNVQDKKMYKHPTIKPLELTEKFIRNSTKVGDVVLDCFMGSGTTGVACRKLQRNFIGIEINEEYFNIAKSRIGEDDCIIQKVKIKSGKKSLLQI